MEWYTVIKTINGRRYRYDDVPRAVGEAMRSTFAKGVFFNRRIRDHYAATRMEDDDPDVGVREQG